MLIQAENKLKYGIFKSTHRVLVIKISTVTTDDKFFHKISANLCTLDYVELVNKLIIAYIHYLKNQNVAVI